MRFAVSSTELLYERAMARFYQAVAYEESEKAKKRSASVLTGTAGSESEIKPRMRVNSLGESDRRSSLRRRLSGEIPVGFQNTLPSKLTIAPIAPKEEDEEEELEEHDHEDYIEEISETKSPEPDEVSEDFEEDYTDSTASSDESETEKFKQAVMSANHNIKRKSSSSARDEPTEEEDEMDTYHPPRDMQPRLMSPYRQQDPSQAAEILTKPFPLPNPDFVPKPILKRPTVDDTKKKVKTSAPDKPKKRILKKLFDRTPSTEKLLKKKSKDTSKVKEPVKPTANGGTLTAAEMARKRMAENRQSSLEENKVMIDHYSDIVKERGAGRQTKLPLYLNPAEVKDDEDDLNVPEPIVEVKKEEPKETTKSIESKPQTPIKIADNPTARSRSISVARNREPLKTIEPDTETTAVRRPRPESKERNNRPRLESRERNTSTTRVPIEQPPQQPTQSTETERMPRRRNPSANRSRSNSAVKRTTIDGTTGTDYKIGTPKIRSRNPSQSPAVKNRLLHPSTDALVNKVPVKINLHSSPPMSRSPEPPYRAQTPEQQIELEEKAELKVRSTMTYVTDLAMFLVACWFYIFKDARLAIPFLLLMVYRQLGDALKDKIPKWMKRKGS